MKPPAGIPSRILPDLPEPPVEIDSQDVVLLIQQFLRENNLPNTLKALEQETSVRFNIIEDPDALRNDILHGKWDSVLRIVRTLQLPPDIATDLYELCILELVEMGEKNAARALRQVPVINTLKVTDPDRYAHLESVLLLSNAIQNSATNNVTRPLYAGLTRKTRRERLAAAIDAWASTPGSGCATAVPPARLVTHLGMSLRWQLENDLLPANSRLPCLLFRGVATALDPATHERAPARQYATTTLQKHAEAAAWSPDGATFVTGAADGAVELWGGATARLRRDVRHQRAGRVLGLPSGVTALTVGYATSTVQVAAGEMQSGATSSAGVSMIVWAGGACGAIRGWMMRTGLVVTKSNHAGGVAGIAAAYNSIALNSVDGAVLASGGFDGSVRVYGYSGRLVCELRGHTGFVSCLLWVGSKKSTPSTVVGTGRKLITGCGGGSVRVWDVRSATCVRVIDMASQSAVVGLCEISSDTIVAATQDKNFYIIDVNTGTITSRLDLTLLGVSTGDAVLSIGIGPKAELVHVLCDDDIVSSVRLKSKILDRRLKVCEKAIGLSTHPSANAYTVWSESGLVSFWCSD